MVQFHQDHEFMVHEGKVYQSYAFQHEVQERAFDPGKPYWAHVSHDPEGYKCYQPTFFVPQKEE
jgi:hypothetical protein